MYNILEARIEFKNNQPERITVLVEMSKGDIRAIFATTKPRGGYIHIQPNATVSNELLQKVAGYGLETVDRDDFPKWKSRLAASIAANAGINEAISEVREDVKFMDNALTTVDKIQDAINRQRSINHKP